MVNLILSVPINLAMYPDIDASNVRHCSPDELCWVHFVLRCFYRAREPKHQGKR